MTLKKKNGKMSVVLACAALLAAASLTVAPTYARYENNNNWSVVYAPHKAEVTADYLVAGGQTVLLSDWLMSSADARKETITLQTSQGTAEGILRCAVDQPEFLMAELEQEACQVSSSGCAVGLVLTPTANALSLTAPETVTIHVGWTASDGEAETLWAEYQVRLLPGNTPVDTQIDGTAEAMTVYAPESFSWEEQIALAAQMPALVDTFVLQFNGGNFPEGTRSTFRGETVMLGDAMQLQFPAAANETVELLLDLSATVPEEEITLSVTALCEGAVTGQAQIRMQSQREKLWVQAGDAEHAVIQGSGMLQYAITEDLTGLSWRVTQLHRTQTGTAYQEDENQFFLTVEVQGKTVDGNTGTYLVISNESGMAPAGSYLLVLERIQQEQLISTVQIPFFIHYGAPGAN